MGQDGLAGDVLGVDGDQGLRGPAHADVQGHAIPVLGAAGQQGGAQGRQQKRGCQALDKLFHKTSKSGPEGAAVPLSMWAAGRRT